MTHRVFVTAEARRNLLSAYHWAAQHAPLTAARWLERFESELLSAFPNRCPLAPENTLVEAEIRELAFGRRRGAFRALFTIVGGEVRVLHVRRASRDRATAEDLKDADPGGKSAT
jgi:plasmid stabilization system protein ParE